MPVSTSIHITHCLHRIITLAPASVLDVGCGFGLWGMLCREYLDVINERVQPSEWQVRIDGIELFEPYIMAHQRALYNSILVADIREAAPTVDEYDLIIAGDVIEHLDKADGEAVIETLYRKAKRALLVNIPLGDGWDHPERHGNPGELHRSQWSVDDFLAYASEYQLFDLPCGEYGVFYCSKEVSAEKRSDALLAAADHALAHNDVSRALRAAQMAYDIDPARPESAVILVDVLLRTSQVAEAIAVLRRTLSCNPQYHFGYLALSRIEAAMSRRAEAAQTLRVLLAMQGVPLELRREGESELAQLTMG